LHLKSFVSYRSFVSDHSYGVRYNIYSSSLQWKIQWIFLRVFLKTFSVALHDIGHHCKIRFWNNTWEYFGKPFWIDQLINKSRSQCVSLIRTHIKSQVCFELIGYYSRFIDDMSTLLMIIYWLMCLQYFLLHVIAHMNTKRNY